MEKFPLKKRVRTLTALFWHYLLSVGGSLLCILVLAFFVFWVLLTSGLVLPANTAESQVREVEAALSDGTLALSEVPYYFRWARLDESGQIVEHSALSHRRQAQIQKAAEDQIPMMAGVPYGQYYRFVMLPDGSRCVLQYDFSMPYATEWLQHHFPELQILMLLLMLLFAVLSTLFWTKRYACILKKDAAELTAATQAILEQRLNTPFQNETHVCEFGRTLQAMDLLRSSLADSLREQWTLEQQRAQEITALAHDLKTPLTVISGNSELLAEETLSEEQRKSVDAILRNAQRMESYLKQLRAVAVQQNQPAEQKTTELSVLFAEWVHMGEELCTPKQICFQVAEPPAGLCCVDVESVHRAMLNLLDNAVRYTPVGGKITLSARVEGDFLTIVVQDSGPGFSQEALIHGCDCFYTDNASRQGTGHMGMGLYLVQCVAKKHHGTVTISNAKSGGQVVLRLNIAS